MNTHCRELVHSVRGLTNTLSLAFSLADRVERRDREEGASGVSGAKDAYNRQWTTAPRHFRVA